MRWVAVAVAVLVGRASAVETTSMEALLGGGRLVAYAARDAAASVRRPRTDAESLAAVGFRAVVTAETSRALAPVCRIFRRAGFRAVLVGIRDPTDVAEVRRALALRRCATSYVVPADRVDPRRLAAVLRRLRTTTHRPVGTRAPAATYAADADLVRLGDWTLATIDPWFAGHHDSQDACGWAIGVRRDLATPPGAPAVIAATGLPTAGTPGTSEYFQRAYFLCLESRQVPLAYVEAFDRPGPDDDVASHRGLFRAGGAPKLWAAQQLHPALEVERTGDELRGRVTDGPPGALRVFVYARAARWERLPGIALGRNGAWRIPLALDRGAAVYVAASDWAAPAVVDVPPVVDRMHVFAARDVPAL